MNNTLTIHHEDTLEKNPDIRSPDPHQDVFSKTIFGFWIYLMTDCLLFATLFTCYAVLHSQIASGPSSHEIFHLPTAFMETMLLLCSSVTCGLIILSSLKRKKREVLGWIILTFILGISFILTELHEFHGLVSEGNSWEKSAFLSSFFTLVGTHGLHVSFGLLWIIVMGAQVYWMGITTLTFRRLVVFSLFWHFLDLVWVFIFTFVYLMGVV